jgi:hypothetical protein
LEQPAKIVNVLRCSARLVFFTDAAPQAVIERLADAWGFSGSSGENCSYQSVLLIVEVGDGVAEAIGDSRLIPVGIIGEGSNDRLSIGTGTNRCLRVGRACGISEIGNGVGPSSGGIILELSNA